MVLIEIDIDKIEKLLECRKTKKRGFENWNLNSLLNQAIFEFWKKYGEEK